ncbi:MAG: hypothetical protein RIK87_02280 [Fuerstiella sp.]
MSDKWVRCKLTAQFLSDAHLGSGSGGGGIDALIARDRYDHPVIWASHIEGVLRDAARRLRGDEEAATFFGRTPVDLPPCEGILRISIDGHVTQRNIRLPDGASGESSEVLTAD